MEKLPKFVMSVLKGITSKSQRHAYFSYLVNKYWNYNKKKTIIINIRKNVTFASMPYIYTPFPPISIENLLEK